MVPHEPADGPMPPGAVAALTLIRPARALQPVHPAELWRYRDLFWLLALRDVKVRYKQTVLGAAWAVVQPLLSMVVLSAVFGRLLGMAEKAGDVPYPIFLYAALVPWTFFNTSVVAAGHSLLAHASMLQKVYFPRLIVPVAALGAPLVDWAVASTLLLGMMVWYATPLTWQVALLPALILSIVVAAAGVGVLLAALTVTYRDVRHVVPFAMQVWFFLTPVILPARELPWSLRWLCQISPVGGTIEAFRAAILGTPIDYHAWAVALASSLTCLAVGILFFCRTERRFADVV